MRRKTLRIIVTYIAYPVAMARYFHEALLRRNDVQVWSAGPYTGRWIPWGGGMNLPEEYLLRLNHPTSLTQPPMVSYPVLEREKPWEPDLWLEVNAGMTALGKPVSAPLAMVLTDPHVLGDFYHPQRSRADFVFGMQTPYLKPGDIWLPYAYSPWWHKPSEIPWKDRKYDAALLGLQYQSRNQLVAALRSKGLRVAYELGPAYGDAMAIYHNTRVGLNWSSLQDTTARCFELMAFGLPAVMNRVPDLMGMFKDGEDFVGFDGLEDAVAHVEGLLAAPERAQKIGANARNSVEPHTWDSRIETILKEVGLI